MIVPTFSPLCRLCLCVIWGAALLEAAAGQPALPGVLPPQLKERVRPVWNIPYVAGGNARQHLDLFLPTESDRRKPLPLIVWVHGGAWKAGDKSSCPAKWLVLRGYAVASLGYRLSQDAIFPAQLEDCKAAIRWLRTHASEYGIDPKRIGVWGGSAGGHLAALLGTTGNSHEFDVGENLDQSSRVQCVVDWFGPTDFLHYGDPVWHGRDAPDSPISELLGGTVSGNVEKARRASPIYYVGKSAAPFLIMQGDKDNLVPEQQSELLDAALKKAGVESTLKILTGAGHGGPPFFSTLNLGLIVEFFDRHLNRLP